MIEEIKKGLQELLSAGNITEAQKEELKKLKKQQELLLKLEEEEKERRLQMDKLTISTFEMLDDYLKAEKLKGQTPNMTEELITLDISGYDFSTNGYKYSYILISNFDAEELKDVHADYLGIRFFIPLTGGVNALIVPNNTIIRSKRNVQVAIIRTNHKLV